MVQTFPAITTTNNPSEEACAEILAVLRRFTTASVGAPDNRDFGALVTHPESGAVIGGLIGSSRWGAFFIDMIAVPDEFREQGLGSQLIEAAEAEACRLHCHLIWLDTYEFQARSFYERHGFEVFGQLDGPAPIYPRYFMRKLLSCDGE